ncbi:hypothetical protein BCV72DRAFT_236864 [Rhizopus microsporus var. microsporus]|uniref:Uncharacterized protein n=1 Tax=Rhizopus microsporus var. microsporus TaxID=86635 RepID=A0A1X0QN13_RHIZD|nr:hypothetical protein BCV72DRAFT_236864 [Rhizopus microsporus var. microsporus]
MSKRNIELLESLADEEQELYLNIRRSRIRKMNQVKANFCTHISLLHSINFSITITTFML